MEKLITWGVVLLLLFINGLSAASNSDDTHHAISINAQPVSYGSIQDAIDSAQDGDTIYIPAGTYYEHVIVNKRVTIIGDGADSTIIDGMGLHEHIIKIISDGVELSGCTIRHCSIGFSGVRIYKDSCHIHDNEFTECGGGVELWNVTNAVIDHNTIEDNTWGVYVHNSLNCSIHDNMIQNNVYGMELGYSTVQIINNSFQKNSLYGVLQLWSNGVIIEYNTFKHHNNIAYQLYSSDYNLIEENDVTENGYGLALYASSNNTIRENNVLSNQYGFYFWFQSNHNYIVHNRVQSILYGIYLGQSNNNIISSNYIINNTQSGIEISYSCCYNIIIENIILENQNGIFLYSSYNTIAKNIIKNNFAMGIFATSSFYNTIIQNNISGGDYGILIGASSFTNQVTYNNISNNVVGIMLYQYSSHNILYKNNIQNNDMGGIWVIHSNNNSLDSNTISNSYEGIVISWISSSYGTSDDNTICHNFIKNNSHLGIYLGKTKYNIVNENIIQDSAIGIVVSNASFNSINNNFVSNISNTYIQLKYSSCNNDIVKNTLVNIYQPIKEQIGINIIRLSNKNKIIHNAISNNNISIAISESSQFNSINENNMINNTNPSFFTSSYPNFWARNYWDDWHTTSPKPIYGELKLERLGNLMIPWVQFDWHPAQEPYEIPS